MALSNKRQTICSVREEDVGEAARDQSPGRNKNEIQEAVRENRKWNISLGKGEWESHTQHEECRHVPDLLFPAEVSPHLSHKSGSKKPEDCALY